MRNAGTVIARAAAAALLACACLFAPAAARAASPMQGMADMPGMKMIPMRKPLPGMSIYNLTSTWTTQDNAIFRLESLRGGPLVAAMVYTHCKDVCPLIAERMQEIETRLPAKRRASVHFALFSLDWVRDTPAQLKLFAFQHHLDPHWKLMHGDEAAVRELAAALGVSFYRDANGDFQHAIAIFLIDADGVVMDEESDLAAAPKAIAGKIMRLPSDRK